MIRTAVYIILMISISSSMIYSQWKQTKGPEGGTVLCIEKVGKEIWAGTEGGLYITKDEGQHWEFSPELPANYIISNILTQGDTTILVVSYKYFPMYWTEYKYKDLLYTRTNDTMAWQKVTINELADNYADLNIVLNTFGLFIDFSVSQDLGVTWSALALPNGISQLRYFDIGTDRIVMQGIIQDSVEHYINYYSKDVGKTWIIMPDFPNNQIYGELFSDKDLLIYLDNSSDSIYVSKDFGNQWDRIKVGNTKFLYTFVKSMRRGEDGNLYTLCNNYLQSNLWKSIDNGITWTMASSSGRDMVILKNGEYLVTGDGVHHVSADLKQWDISNNKLIATVCPFIFLSPQSDIYAMDGELYWGSGEFFVSKNGGTSWQHVLPDSLNNDVFISNMLFIGDTIVAVNKSKILFTFNKGLTWQQNALPNYANYYKQGLASFKNKIFVGADKIYITSDWGKSWEISGSPPGLFCSDIIVVNNELFAIFNNGQILKSDDEGKNWIYLDEISISDSGINKLEYLNGTIFAIVNGQVKFSIDLGISWSILGKKGIPRHPNLTVRDTLISSVTNVGNLLVATVPNEGVYISGNMGGSWLPYNEGLNNFLSEYVAAADSILYLGTYSTGIWQRGNILKVVSGTVFYDENNNGLQDPGELPVKDAIVSALPLKSYSSSSVTGLYSIIADIFKDTLKVKTDAPYTISIPSYHQVSSTGGTYNFGIQLIPDIKDLQITITNTAVLRPGFDNSFVITIKNIGTTGTNGKVKMVIPYGIVFNSSNPLPDEQIADTLTWYLPTLIREEAIRLTVNCKISHDLKINDIVYYGADVILDDDKDPTNNHDEHSTVIVGSYDPNDKSVFPEKWLTPDRLETGTALEYTIRFQNTGNFPADFIRVIDTLDKSLNPSTFKILSSSHPCSWTIQDQGIVEFYFQNINLPSIEPESHGFVKFSVAPFTFTSIGTGIPNRAFIFFDYNPAIITNTVETKIGFPVQVYNEKSSESFIIYPNPTNKNLQFIWENAPHGEVNFQLYDLKGNLCYQKMILLSVDNGKINLPKLIPGNYQLKLEQKNRKAIGMINIQD